jgi:uncharacterized repeat protein (TIGR04138 family)
MKKRIDQIAKEDGRFNPNALNFVYEGISYTAKKFYSEPTHVTGQALSVGLRDLAIEKWGRLAQLVLESWGIKSTSDFGDIVFLMIENQWMSAQPTDTIEDFDNVFDFQTAFKTEFKF